MDGCPDDAPGRGPGLGDSASLMSSDSPDLWDTVTPLSTGARGAAGPAGLGEQRLQRRDHHHPFE